jgi:thiamine-phosphate pyrophosphorylase
MQFDDSEVAGLTRQAREQRTRTAIRGFYAVLDRDDESLARTLVGAGGARVLQVRLKPAGAAEILRVARMARRVCDETGALLIINDRIDVAIAARADGVHLGQTDTPIADARALCGDIMIIGVSTHNVDQVQRAVAAGADYLGFGPIFATTTKANPDPVQGIEGLRSAVAATVGPANIPIVAIGGIAVVNAPEIYATGAAAICAISAVNRAADVAMAIRALANPAFDPSDLN